MATGYITGQGVCTRFPRYVPGSEACSPEAIAGQPEAPSSVSIPAPLLAPPCDMTGTTAATCSARKAFVTVVALALALLLLRCISVPMPIPDPAKDGCCTPRNSNALPHSLLLRALRLQVHSQSFAATAPFPARCSRSGTRRGCLRSDAVVCVPTCGVCEAAAPDGLAHGPNISGCAVCWSLISARAIPVSYLGMARWLRGFAGPVAVVLGQGHGEAGGRPPPLLQWIFLASSTAFLRAHTRAKGGLDHWGSGGACAAQILGKPGAPRQ